jgi:hypothetical protein
MITCMQLYCLECCSFTHHPRTHGRMPLMLPDWDGALRGRTVVISRTTPGSSKTYERQTRWSITDYFVLGKNCYSSRFVSIVDSRSCKWLSMDRMPKNAAIIHCSCHVSPWMWYSSHHHISSPLASSAAGWTDSYVSRYDLFDVGNV